MADILTAADLAELRRDFVRDEIDLRPEWGSGGAKATSGAAVGAGTLALTALGSGTIKRDTPFDVVSSGVPARYTVTADATITTTAATVSITPLVVRTISANDPATAEPYTRSVYNRVFGRVFFSDVGIQDLARQAEERWGVRFQEAGDVRRARFRGIELLAVEAYLASSEYELAVIQMNATDGGKGHFERLEKRRDSLRVEVAYRTTGPAHGILTR